MSPIFMIGTQRSGSNLLRLMLNQLPDVASPHPPHILQRMYPLLDRYGDLSIDSNFRMLVYDVCLLIELNPVEWPIKHFDREEVMQRCQERHLLAIYQAVHDICAEEQGASTWCCKSLGNVHYGEDIEEFFDDAKFIYLYRDGRDVAVSFRKAVVGEKHFYHIAKEWAEAQEKALALAEHIGPERFVRVSYEELTQSPEATARRICDSLGVAYTPAMLEYHKTDEAQRAASSSTLWNKVTRPVQTNNSKKYLREASEEQVAIFESVAGHVLDALGYERSFVKPGQERCYTVDEITGFDKENERLKREVMAEIDKEDLKRRNRQDSLLQSIKTRRVA